jgi:hypothetical protein
VDRVLLDELLNEVMPLRGSAAEIGVYCGESAQRIADTLGPDCVLHLFDTCCGMMAEDVSSDIDGHREGEFKASKDTIRHAMAGRNYCLHVGRFPETAFDLKLKFVHVDCDLYIPTLAALRWGWRNLIDGGVMLCDDYGFILCGGAKKAVHEFCKEFDVKLHQRHRRVWVKKC